MADVENNEELDLDKKVTVRSIAGWTTGFKRIDGMGNVKIAPEGTTRLTRNEIIGQVQNGNTLFNGKVDDMGSHATLYIEDKPTRVEVGFESEDGSRKQSVFSEDIVTKLFNRKSQELFEKDFRDAIRTRAEKYAVIQTIRRLKLNDYAKISFAESYTGFKVKE